MTIHPFFTKKARAAFAAAGGDPDRCGDLARWAQDAKTRGVVHEGVIIGQSGTIYAGTLWDIDAPMGVTHVRADDAKALGLTATELSLALAGIERRVGEPVIHIPASDVTSGAAQYIKES